MSPELVVVTVRRASKEPKREKLIEALFKLVAYASGSALVYYSHSALRGWGAVNLTITGLGGKWSR